MRQCDWVVEITKHSVTLNEVNFVKGVMVSVGVVKWSEGKSV
jgi:hypothetical protein